jgi:TusA-related sulfurtransferase
MPVVKTAKAIKEVEVGQVLKMIATDRALLRTWKHGAGRPGMSGLAGT